MYYKAWVLYDARLVHWTAVKTIIVTMDINRSCKMLAIMDALTMLHIFHEVNQ